ncbi:hypothetical protein PAECIP111891_00479 [Paenibacillus allorhizoplanae]|uniref:Peptidase M60 domain-containing protein n=1 Tax=Paenibacillus allorhizoplanae TaxID=2905648 RepID=A0ABM9BTJ8_9BACL|nr:M60 family metallopeptidase [Paenibacillus allorhizoplanae]CAH1193038.1 hypothetical protein PAECIP111891_00479 [Paenibacillus allorhizoplanae]
MKKTKKIAVLLSLSLVLPTISTFCAVHSVAAATSVSNSDNTNLDHDLNLLYSDLQSYPDFQYESTITIFGTDAFAVTLDEGKSPLAGASRYGAGRIIAAGAEDYLNLTASTATTEGKLTRNMLLWLTEDKSPNPATGATNRYSNALIGTEMLKLITKNELPNSGELPIDQTVVSSWTNQPLDPLVYPIAFVDPMNVSSEEAIALEAYVINGGSVIVTSKGWVMTAYPPDTIRSQAKDPLNVKITDYPVQWLLNQAGLGINDDYISMNDPNTKPTSDQLGNVNLSYLSNALQHVEANSKTFMDYAIAGENVPQDVWERINSNILHGWKSIVPNSLYLSGVKSSSDAVMSALTLPLDRIQKPYTSVLVEYRSSFASLDGAGVKFAGADVFPGKVENTVPRVAKTIAVKMDYADTSYLRMYATPKHWVSTGSYAPAGSEITIDVPADEPDLVVQIGAHTDELTGKGITKWDRLPSVVLKKKLNPGFNRISSPYGGLVYIIPAKSKPGRTVNVNVGGVIQAPHFVLGQTSEQAWKDTIRNYPAPWAELRSNHIALTVPADDIRLLDNPQQLMEKWDEIYSLYEIMSGLAPDKALPDKSIDNWPFRYVADKQITNGWMHAGDPIMLYQGETSKQLVNLDAIQHDGWGFWHELGHNFQMDAWTWGDNREVTNNLHSLHVQEYYGNESRLKDVFPQAAQFVANTDPNKDFESISDVFVRLVMFTQLKYAYGWDFYAKLHAAYREMNQSSLPADLQQQKDLLVLTASRMAGANLLEFFDHWGFKYSSSARDAVAVLGLQKPTNAIWNLTADIDKPQLIPQFQMSASATSEELVSETDGASNVLDGDPNTIWHTKWDLYDTLPESITLNLGGTYDVNKIKVVPRQGGGSNGMITAYNVYASTDGIQYTKVVSGTWAKDATEKTAEFPATRASFIKLEATAGQGGWASAAEMNVYRVIEAPNVALTMLSAAGTVQTGQEFNVQLDLGSVTQSVYAQDIKMDYNSNVFEFVSARPLRDGINLVETRKDILGKLRFIIASVGKAVTGNAGILELKIKAKAVTQPTTGTIAVTDATLGDSQGAESQAQASTVNVRIATPPPGIPGDVNHDNRVSIGDLGIVAANYGKTSVSSPDWEQIKQADVTGDGEIDIDDLALVASKLME